MGFCGSAILFENAQLTTASSDWTLDAGYGSQCVRAMGMEFSFQANFQTDSG